MPNVRIPNKLQLRSLWLKVHKWLGLTLAVPVILIFLSGSALVWKDSVDALLHPARQVDARAAADPSFYVSAAVQQLAPGEAIASLSYPSGAGPVPVVVMAADSQRIRLFLHPTTGELIERTPLYDRPMLLLHRLHGSLLLYRLGGRVVGWISVLLLLSAFSGLWLWWPFKGPWVRGLRWKRTQSANTNLHHQAGFWVALPLVVLSITGASITFPNFFNRVLGTGFAVRAESARAAAPPLTSPRLSFRQALSIGGVRGDSRLEGVTWPTTADDHWIISFTNAAEGDRLVRVDDRNGRLGSVGTYPETTMRLMRRIHDGTEMPFLWQVIIFVTGLIGPLLGITGVIIWLGGRKRQKEMRGRRAQRA